jgi:hypothetical protein
MAWVVEVLDSRVQDELESQGHGLERIGEPHVKHLEGRLWEMRMEGKDGNLARLT